MSQTEITRSLAAQLEEAWNAGKGAAFGAAFAAHTQFVTTLHDVLASRAAAGL